MVAQLKNYVNENCALFYFSMSSEMAFIFFV